MTAVQDNTFGTFDRYQQITNRIIEALKSGTPPWNRPWRMTRPMNAISKRPYQSINRLLLELRAQEAGFRSNRWITYTAAQEAGGHVNRGERGTAVIFYKPIERLKAQSAGGDDSDTWEIVADDRPSRLIIRSYTLFNLEQTSGLEALYELPCAVDEQQTAHDAWALLNSQGATIRYGGHAAAYVPRLDEIWLPSPAEFHSASGFFGTAFHELGHWTGAVHRLNRTMGRFGDLRYAYEELVAELTAAFLLGEVELPIHTVNTAAYLKSWLELLANDASAIITATRDAQRAADYVCGRILEPGATDQPQRCLPTPHTGDMPMQ